MREFIVSENYYESVRYMEAKKELIRCADCRFYAPISSDKLKEVVNGKFDGICGHPQGPLGINSYGYCYYAKRKEDVPGMEV